MADFHVVAPLVVVLTKNGVQHLYHGDTVPAGITAESLANLKALGFVAEDKPAPADKK